MVCLRPFVISFIAFVGRELGFRGIWVLCLWSKISFVLCFELLWTIDKINYANMSSFNGERFKTEVTCCLIYGSAGYSLLHVSNRCHFITLPREHSLFGWPNPSSPSRRAHRIFEWGTWPQGGPHADESQPKKSRWRSSIHPGRSQLQDGPFKAWNELYQTPSAASNGGFCFSLGLQCTLGWPFCNFLWDARVPGLIWRVIRSYSRLRYSFF